MSTPLPVVPVLSQCSNNVTSSSLAVTASLDRLLRLAPEVLAVGSNDGSRFDACLELAARDSARPRDSVGTCSPALVLGAFSDGKSSKAWRCLVLS